MRLRRLITPEEDTGPDMSPMIDIVFNLLIFFLCATKFKTAEGAIDSYLPKSEGLNSSPTQIEIDEVRVTVRKVEGGEVRVSVGANPLNEPGDWQRGVDTSLSPVWGRLGQELAALKAAHKGVKPLPVTLDVKPDVSHQHAVSALNEVVRAGLKEVRFAAPGKAID